MFQKHLQEKPANILWGPSSISLHIQPKRSNWELNVRSKNSWKEEKSPLQRSELLLVHSWKHWLCLCFRGKVSHPSCWRPKIDGESHFRSFSFYTSCTQNRNTLHRSCNGLIRGKIAACESQFSSNRLSSYCRIVMKFGTNMTFHLVPPVGQIYQKTLWQNTATSIP